MLNVPPTTALQPAPLSIEGLPMPISAAIVNLVIAATAAGFHSDMSGVPNEHSEDACLAARSALVDAIRAELQSARIAALEPVAALSFLTDKTDLLVKHLQKTHRLEQCFNLPALDVARAAIANAAGGAL